MTGLSPVRIFAAGSLRRAFMAWREDYCARSGNLVEIDFGPAGLLRQRIAQGERVDLYASANVAHPVALLAHGDVIELRLFAANCLCLTARRERVSQFHSWLDILRSPELTLATSTPGDDPGGDYAQQLFATIERLHPGDGKRIAQKARHLVGGKKSLTIPAGESTPGWLILQGMTDTFIGYQSTSITLRDDKRLQLMAIPADYNVRADYMLATFTPRGQELADELCSDTGQYYLRQHGFLPLTPR